MSKRDHTGEILCADMNTARAELRMAQLHHDAVHVLYAEAETQLLRSRATVERIKTFGKAYFNSIAKPARKSGRGKK